MHVVTYIPAYRTGNLTEHQYRFLVMLRDYRRSHNRAPSWGEMAKALDRSTSSPRQTAKLLADRGFVSREAGVYRSISITPRGANAMARYARATEKLAARDIRSKVRP